MPGAEYDVSRLGQVFTGTETVDYMLSLRRNHGRVLEPSCGGGAFSDRLIGEDLVAIELDPAQAPAYAKVMDFFAYPKTERFSTIIGNPPYVRFQDILPETREMLDMTLFDSRSNLFLFFIHRCVEMLEDGGELIFIVPRELLKLTSAARLNEWLYRQGTITDAAETGDDPIFATAAPNCLIFRFEKGNMSHRTDGLFFGVPKRGLRFLCHEGQMLFLDGEYDTPLSDLFFVKVGGVSGADDIFTHPAGNIEVVCSRTQATGELRRMFHGTPAPELLPHKERLLARRIKAFSEENWYAWGRDFYLSDAPRIYVNGRTRTSRPFFTNPCDLWDGSVLALFPRDAEMDLERACDLLNDVNWQELGFLCDGRFLFTQRSLENALLPPVFRTLARPKDTSEDVA